MALGRTRLAAREFTAQKKRKDVWFAMIFWIICDETILNCLFRHYRV
jgi:hypothetical protein